MGWEFVESSSFIRFLEMDTYGSVRIYDIANKDGLGVKLADFSIDKDVELEFKEYFLNKYSMKIDSSNSNYINLDELFIVTEEYRHDNVNKIKSLGFKRKPSSDLNNNEFLFNFYMDSPHSMDFGCLHQSSWPLSNNPLFDKSLLNLFREFKEVRPGFGESLEKCLEHLSRPILEDVVKKSRDNLDRWLQ